MKKTGFIPKIILLSFFLLVVTLHVTAQKVTLSYKNVPFEKVLNSIKQQTGLSLVFSEQLVDVNRKVSINVTSEEVKDVLKQLLVGTNVDFEIKNSKLYLVEKKTADSQNTTNQSKKNTGLVTDEKGEPIIGATVMIIGEKTGTITNTKGEFSLELSEGKKIIVSYIGFIPQELLAKNYQKVVLIENNQQLDEVVVVGYGTQKKATVTGSISTVQSKDLVIAPMASTSNALAGRLPGLVAIQSSGQPGADAAYLSIRGFGSALLIVDGVEADFNSIDANQIESVSILKDGAASIYGSRAGNGVILVTTKRGSNNKPQITLNSSSTLQGITIMPTPASSGQYTEMISEAYLQSGKPANSVPYTPEQIQKYYEGTDPQYPNTNWYNVLVRDWAPQQQHNLSVRGGSDKIKYYGFIGYLNQESMWKTNGGVYSRYNLQSNIDAKITNDLSLQLDLASIIGINNSTWRPQGDGGNSVWQDFWNTLPIYPATLPDPTKISFADGGGTGGAQVVTNRDIAGYNDTNNQEFKGTLSLNYNIPYVKGLSVKAFVNYLMDYSANKYFSKPVQFYTYDPSSGIYTLAGSLGTQASLTISNNTGRTLTTQYSITYDRIFNVNHHFTALGLFEEIDYSNDYLTASRINFITPSIDQLFGGSTTGMSNNGSASEMGRKSYVGRLNYSFKEKYLIEADIRADASAKFPSNKRWGYFPSVSIGWRVNQEGFMKNLKDIDNLKLRLSYGESGYDNVGNFQYLSGYKLGKTYLFNGVSQPGIVSTGLANPDLTWEKITIYNAGLDFSFWNRKLYGEGDVFYRTLAGIPATRIMTLPSTFGSTLPPENLNSMNTRGFEFKLGTAGKYNDLIWDISGNISWSRSKWDHFEEPVYTDPDQIRIYKQSGQWVDRAVGYVSDGLFTSQDEINNMTFDEDGQANKTLKPGDIKFKDLNHDGILNWKDETEIGQGNLPHWMVGFNTNLNYKNFDLSMLFQGAFGYSNYIVLQQKQLPPAIVYDLRWTETNNNPKALVPRLGGAITNSLSSDYFYKDASYLRLKNISIGYNLPKKILKQIAISQCRIYVAGTNLLTLYKLSIYQTDPEAPSGQSGYYYPQQKTITLGLNVTL